MGKGICGETCGKGEVVFLCLVIEFVHLILFYERYTNIYMYIYIMWLYIYHSHLSVDYVLYIFVVVVVVISHAEKTNLQRKLRVEFCG